MTRRAYIYFALTFLLGVIVGGVGVFYYTWHTGHWHRGFSRERVVRHLKRELNLTDAQVQQLNQIMDDAGAKHRQLQQQVEPQFQALHEETQNRIRQILNPDQLQKFNEIVRQREERARQHKGP
jgi:Spy/CpxP family protein refolding chaperone